MDVVYGKLTVFFEDPFWVGVFERVENDRLSACKITFGAEPRDCEVWAFVLKNYCRLRFSPAVEAAVRSTPANPKRMQREARKQSLKSGVGTKSQQALQLQREETKLERKIISRTQKEAEKQRQIEKTEQKTMTQKAMVLTRSESWDDR